MTKTLHCHPSLLIYCVELVYAPAVLGVLRVAIMLKRWPMFFCWKIDPIQKETLYAYVLKAFLQLYYVHMYVRMQTDSMLLMDSAFFPMCSTVFTYPLQSLLHICIQHGHTYCMCMYCTYVYVHMHIQNHDENCCWGHCTSVCVWYRNSPSLHLSCVSWTQRMSML